MMSRLIDQFHRPDRCRIACLETENIMKELQALARAIETNECPHAIKKRFEQQEWCPRKVGPADGRTDHCGGKDAATHKPLYAINCPKKGFDYRNCDCNKRNGLQDECLRACCRGRPYRV